MCRSMSHEPMLTMSDIINAMGNPHWLDSIPFTRFIPKSEDMSVGNISMMENDVRVRITVFILLLMIDVYVSIVDSRISAYMCAVSRACDISMFTSSIRSASNSSIGSLNFSFCNRVSLPLIEVIKYVNESCSLDRLTSEVLFTLWSMERFALSSSMEICFNRFRYHTEEERNRRKIIST